MADLKISALTASTTPLAGTEVLPIVQSSTTKQVSVANLTAGRAVSMQSVTANNTGLATPVGNFQSGDQAGSRVAIINNGAGGQTFHLVTGNPGVSNSGFALYDSTNSATRLYVGSSTGDLTLNTGNLVVSNGKGIDFSATPGTGTSELLADYEEGTWTPTLTDLTNNATTASATCSYTKVGRMVTVMGYFETGGLGSVSGNIYISGLPFAQVNNAGGLGAGSIGYAANMNLVLGQSVTLASESNQTYMSLRLWDALTGTTAMQASEWANNGAVVFTCTYRAT